MAVSREPGDIIVTHALGSCLGIAVHDPVAQVGGLLHVMLPESKMNPDKASANPYMFVDSGVPMFFRQLYEAGGIKNRLVVKVAGGASIHRQGEDQFAIGKRNFMMLKKIFWKNGIMVDAESVGGTHPRTMYLEIGSGRVRLSTAGVENSL